MHSIQLTSAAAAIQLTRYSLCSNSLTSNWLNAHYSLNSVRCSLFSPSPSHIATDGQSVSKSWCRAPSGAHDQIFITVWHLRSCLRGAPSLTRGRVCLKYMMLALARYCCQVFLPTHYLAIGAARTPLLRDAVYTDCLATVASRACLLRDVTASRGRVFTERCVMIGVGVRDVTRETAEFTWPLLPVDPSTSQYFKILIESINFREIYYEIYATWGP
jgi:hypothetical protein